MLNACQEGCQPYHRGHHPHPELSTMELTQVSLGTSKAFVSRADSCDGWEILPVKLITHRSCFWPLDGQDKPTPSSILQQVCWGPSD